MESGIYAIVNKVNGKRYVGSSMNRRRRIQDHRSSLVRQDHPNQHLQRAWNKYGEESFDFIYVEDVPEDLLLDVEQRYLDENTNGYNIAVCSTAPMKGRKQTPEAIERRSAKMRGRKWTAERKQRFSIARKGIKLNRVKPCSEECKRKIGDANRGRSFTSEQCKSFGNSMRGKQHSDETRRKMVEGQKAYWAAHKEERLANRKPMTDEHRQRLSESITAAWARRKAREGS